MSQSPPQLLTADSTLGVLLDHPALEGFAEWTLPWYGRDYDRVLTIADIDRLLPYHSAVDTPTVVQGLNRLVETASAGVLVFAHIYSEAEREQDPQLNAAGVFFFPGRPGAPYALIAPGGGFSYVGSVHEGFPYAVAIANAGFNAFVVTYRTGQGGRIATRDMARAVDFIANNAEGYQVSTKGYSVWGSSAGARIAAFIGSNTPAGHGGQSAERPAAVIMAYTSHSPIGDQDPPTYVIVGDRDSIAPPLNMAPRVKALHQAGVEVTYNVVPGVGHGFGAGTGTPAQGWLEEAITFWASHIPAE